MDDREHERARAAPEELVFSSPRGWEQGAPSQPPGTRRLLAPPSPRERRRQLRRERRIRRRTELRRRLHSARHWVILAGVVTGAVLLQLPGSGLTSGPSVAFGVDGRPTPQRAVSKEPLGVPPVLADQAGPYRFLALQEDGETPVAYDPCRPLRYVVNTRTAPPGAEALLVDAIATVSAATGLRFEAGGASDEPAVADRPPFQKERYGDRWAPILIAWSDAAELADLAGDVAGIGGSAWTASSAWGPEVYVSGMVALDGPQLAGMLRRPGGSAEARGVIIHELAHLVGLAHVDDPTQLMHISSSLSAPQAGDLAGLSRLGAGRCFRRL